MSRLFLEWQLIWRNRLVRWATIIVSLLSILALGNGELRVRQLQAEIHQTQATQSQQHKDQARLFASGGLAGESAYYTFHIAYHSPQPLTALALGHFNEQPSTQRIRALALYGQLFDGAVQNPEISALGGFDFAFVVIFISPLLVIALLHDLRAREIQAMRLGLLHSLQILRSAADPQVGLRQLLWLRIALNGGLIAGSVLLPLIGFGLLFQKPLAGVLFATLLSALYLAVWILLAAFFALRGQAASAIAVRLLGVWLTGLFFLPALAQQWVNARHGHEPLALIALDHRQWVNHAWDLPKQATLDAFGKLYPQFADTPPVLVRFHYKWYYAFHFLADHQVHERVDRVHRSLAAKHRTLSSVSWLLPALGAQQSFDALGQSDVKSLIKYRTAVRDFHRRLSENLHPYVFYEAPFHKADFDALPHYIAPNATQQLPWRGLLPLLFWLITLIVAVHFRLADKRISIET